MFYYNHNIANTSVTYLLSTCYVSFPHSCKKNTRYKNASKNVSHHPILHVTPLQIFYLPVLSICHNTQSE